MSVAQPKGTKRKGVARKLTKSEGSPLIRPPSYYETN